MAEATSRAPKGSAIQVEAVPLGRFHRPVRANPASSLPGLVLIQDVWGLSEHSDALARDFAREGLGVLEIDLYREMGPTKIVDVGAQIRSLSDPAVLADLERGADWLRYESPACRDRSVGVVGVCMGGTYALLAACLSDRFSAAAPFYGILSYDEGMLAYDGERDRDRKPLSPIEAAGRLKTPLIASFGDEDHFVPSDHVAALEAGFSASGVEWAVDRYPAAGHAFLNRSRPEAYRADASSAAWKRIIPFLRSALDPPRV